MQQIKVIQFQQKLSNALPRTSRPYFHSLVLVKPTVNLTLISRNLKRAQKLN